MSFKLILDIRGLCLLVPHDRKMHVLIPETAHHAQHSQHMDPHTALITYGPENARTSVPFDGRRWDLSALVQGRVSPTLPSVVVDVRRFVRPEGLPRKQVERGRQAFVSSHLILSAGGSACHGESAEWRIGSERHVWMTNKVRWIIPEVEGTALNWSFEDVRTGSPIDPQPEPVVPDTQNQVVLDLLHAPEGEHGNTRSRGCDPGAENHFPMFYDLFGQPSSARARCESGQTLPEDCLPLTPGSMGAEIGLLNPAWNKGADVFTCMLGQAWVDPEST